MMNATKWLIIVRQGATEEFERLTTQFADDPDVVVQFDRRVGPRRRLAQWPADERRKAERRAPEDPRLLIDGWFMVEALPRDSQTPPVIDWKSTE